MSSPVLQIRGKDAVSVSRADVPDQKTVPFGALIDW